MLLRGLVDVLFWLLVLTFFRCHQSHRGWVWHKPAITSNFIISFAGFTYCIFYIYKVVPFYHGCSLHFLDITNLTEAACEGCPQSHTDLSSLLFDARIAPFVWAKLHPFTTNIFSIFIHHYSYTIMCLNPESISSILPGYS